MTTTIRRTAAVLTGAVLLAALAGCSSGGSGVPQGTPTPTGPAPTVAQSGQVFQSPQLDITLSPVSGAGGVTVPDANGGVAITVSKTGTPQQATQNTTVYVPGDGLGFVALEIASAQLATPFPTWKAGTTTLGQTTAQFLVDNTPVGQPVTVPMAGGTSDWTITAPTSSPVVLQITSGTVVQSLDARTGQPVQVRDAVAPVAVTFAGENTSPQTTNATSSMSSFKPFTGTISLAFPAGSAYLAGYVTGAGWAPDGQDWLFIDLKDTVLSTFQCDNSGTGCYAFSTSGIANPPTTFTLTTASGQTATAFGSSPNGYTTQFIYQVPANVTSFSLKADATIDLDSWKQTIGLGSFTFTPAQLPFSHTYTLTFQ